MKKSTKLSLIILIFLLIITGYSYFQYFIKIPKVIATDSWVFKFPDKYEQYEIVKCNLFDVMNPEYAFVGILTVYGTRSYEVDFYNLEKNNPFSETKVNYTGGTTVTNTTFPELVKMVKEDCGQFQESYIDLTGYENYNDLSSEEQSKIWPEIDAKNLGWTYTPYTPEPEEEPQPEMTEEEKEAQRILEEYFREQAIERRANSKPIEDLFE